MSSLRLNRRHFLAGASGGAVLGVLGSPAKAWASVEVAPTTLGENLIVGPIAEISLPNRLAVDMFLKGPGPSRRVELLPHAFYWRDHEDLDLSAFEVGDRVAVEGA